MHLSVLQAHSNGEMNEFLKIKQDDSGLSGGLGSRGERGWGLAIGCPYSSPQQGILYTSQEDKGNGNDIPHIEAVASHTRVSNSSPSGPKHHPIL